MNNVTRLPRKAVLPLARSNDHALEEIREALDSAGLGVPSKTEAPPDPQNPNSILCRACGEAEYMTREHCRCGAYLHGQLLDELTAYASMLRSRGALLAKKERPRLMFGLAVVFIYLFGLVKIEQWLGVPIQTAMPILFGLIVFLFARGRHFSRVGARMIARADEISLDEFYDILRRNKQATQLKKQ